MLGMSEWEYFIVKDEFQIYFPEGPYTIDRLVDWYKIIPTKPEKISYYGDNTELLKQHFTIFTEFGDVKTKIGNDMHSNHFLTIWCMAIYDLEEELVGFAAQEFLDDKPGEKKIRYFGELNEQYYINM